MLDIIQRHQHNSEQGPTLQIEAQRGVPSSQIQSGFLSLVFRKRSKIEDGQLEIGGIMDDLDRLSLDCCEGRSPNFVPTDYLRQASLQRLSVASTAAM